METCETCRWAEYDYVGAGVFGRRCKRFPPTPILFAETLVQQEHFQRVWPVVDSDDYCGEWAEKDIGNG